jgi:hypothetical protein
MISMTYQELGDEPSRMIPVLSSLEIEDVQDRSRSGQGIAHCEIHPAPVSGEILFGTYLGCEHFTHSFKTIPPVLHFVLGVTTLSDHRIKTSECGRWRVY